MWTWTFSLDGDQLKQNLVCNIMNRQVVQASWDLAKIQTQTFEL